MTPKRIAVLRLRTESLAVYDVAVYDDGTVGSVYGPVMERAEQVSFEPMTYGHDTGEDDVELDDIDVLHVEVLEVTA